MTILAWPAKNKSPCPARQGAELRRALLERSSHMVAPTRPAVKGQTIYNSNGRAVGRVDGRTFHKNVQGSRHMLRQPRGWASDVAALRAALDAGATHIEVKDTENNAVYRASIEFMLDHGLRFNRGFGDQVALALDRWQRPDKGLQLGLFAEVRR